MRHRWRSVPWPEPTVFCDECELCGVTTYGYANPARDPGYVPGDYRRIRYVYARPYDGSYVGPQPECPETCEETARVVEEGLHMNDGAGI